MISDVGGLKYDQDKVMWHLIPRSLLLGVAKVLTFGAKKYAPNSWQKVEGERYYSAMNRHLDDIVSGEYVDSESTLPHAFHFLCNAIFIAWKLMNRDTEWLIKIHKG